MAVNTFGITAASVRAHAFPNSDDFSSTSSPTSATVGEIIDDKAAELQGRLLKESVAAASITSNTSAEYLWCRETLRLMVAIQVYELMSGQSPEVAKAWQAKLDARLKRLEDDGPTALGNASLASGLSDADGPTTHISELSLDVGDTDLASDVAPRFRRSDLL